MVAESRIRPGLAYPEHLLKASLFQDARVPVHVTGHWLDGDLFPHDHDFVEFVLIAEGEGTHVSLTGQQLIAAGDVLILRPGVWHNYVGCRRMRLVNCNVALELLQGDLAAIMQDPALHYLLWTGPLSLERQGLIKLGLQPDAMAACEQYLARLGGMLAPRSAYTYADKLGYLLLLLGELTRGMGPEFRQASEHTAPLHPAVSSGQNLLREALAHPWTLSELAGRLYIAPSYLVRLFHSTTGLSPMAYLARCRAEQAASLLIRTDCSVAEIGAAVGWDDPNYFARRFRAHFGLSATAYRARFAAASTLELPLHS